MNVNSENHARRNSKSQTLKNAIKILAVVLLTVCLALLPLSVFAMADAARFQAVQSVQQPYTSMQISGDDFYLLRLLRSRTVARYGAMTGNNVPSLYLAAQTVRESMTQSPGMSVYSLDLLEKMEDSGVLSSEWVDAVKQQTEADPYSFYTSSDTLGLITISYFVSNNRATYNTPTVFNITVDGKTGAVVSLFLTDTQEHPVPAKATVLQAFVQQAGLSSLPDWAPPLGTNYEKSGLYSAQGQALATYTFGQYAAYYAYGAQEKRFYCSLLLSTLDADKLGAVAP